MITKKHFRRPGMAILALALSATVLQGCGSEDSDKAAADNDLVAAMEESKVLTIGTSNDVPWSSVSASGEAEGIIPDILREYLERADLGDVKIKSVPMPFDSLIPSITSNRIQVIGDAIFDTPERQKQVQFTAPVFYNTEALVVAKGNPKKLTSLADLCGFVGGTYKGTSWVQDLKTASEECADDSIKVQTYDTVNQVMQDIANGRVDGGLIDSSIAAHALSKNPDLKIELSEGYTPLSREKSKNALAVASKEKTFADSFDKHYAEMLSDGTVAEIFERNGLAPAEVWLP